MIIDTDKEQERWIDVRERDGRWDGTEKYAEMRYLRWAWFNNVYRRWLVAAIKRKSIDIKIRNNFEGLIEDSK